MKTRTIKTKPREVRGRKMRILQEGTAGSVYFTAEQLRAFRREAQVRSSTTPEGDAVSNVEEQAKDSARDLSWATYRLTKAGLRRIRKHNAADTQDTVPAEVTQVQSGTHEVSESLQTASESPDVPFHDDPGKRPLSADEIEKGRNHQRKKRRAELDKQQPAALSAHTVQPILSQKKPSTMLSKEAEAAPLRQPVQMPRTRQKSTGVIHGRPPYPLPRIRGSPETTEKLPAKVSESKPRLLIRTANLDIRSEARISAAMAAKANARASELAAEHASRNAQRAARHMAEVTRRAAQHTAKQLKRSSEGAL